MKKALATLLLRLPANPITDRFVRWLVRPKNGSAQSVSTRMGYRLTLTQDPVLLGLRTLVMLGRYEASYIALLSRLVGRGDTVVDVGANEATSRFSSRRWWGR